MSTFELQVYKTGIWNVDSYFDDRDLAMSEAERLTASSKHAGVRLLQEDYDDAANISSCRVVYTRMRQSEEDQDWRVEAKRTLMVRAASGSGRGEADDRPGKRRRPPVKKSNTSLYIILAIGFIVLIAGAAAMIGLQEIAKFL